MLGISSIVLLCAVLCQCNEDESLLSYPIGGTSYMVQFDKQLRTNQFEKTLYGKVVRLNGTGFWTKLDNGEQFKKDESKVLPLLPAHPLFCKRLTDSEEGNIRIAIDWSKDLFASQRTDFTLEIILYNYRGDILRKFDINKNSGSGNLIEHDTQTQPRSDSQKYLDTFDACDLLSAAFRVKTTKSSSPWTFLIVYPEQLTVLKALSSANNWDTEKIIEQQSTFMAMSMLVTGAEWNEHAFKFGMLTWFSLAAGMTKKELTEDKYLSAIAVPKSGSQSGDTYSIRDIGQRSGAGFGLLYWNTVGHRFSEKFQNNFKTGSIINNHMFQEFVKTCFDYGTILDARSKVEMDNNNPEEAKYRNKYESWNYNFDGHTIRGERKLTEETVDAINWTLDTTRTWTTTADGKIKVEKE